MSTGAGMSIAQRELKFNFMVVDADVPNKGQVQQQLAELYRLAGTATPHTIFLRVDPADIAIGDTVGYAERSVLMIPRFDLNGVETAEFFNNSTMQRFYGYKDEPAGGPTTAENAPGTPCIFQISEIPGFSFTGTNIVKQVFTVEFLDFFQDPAQIVDDASALGYGKQPWTTFLQTGYKNVNDLYPQVNVPIIQELVAKHLNVLTKNITLTFTPQIYAIRAVPNPDVIPTTLAELEDVNLGVLPVTHNTTRLTYLPDAGKWENVPVLQLHEWKYAAGYTAPLAGEFKLNGSIFTATKLAAHKTSVAGYDDGNWLTGLFRGGERYLLFVEFNNFIGIWKYNDTVNFDPIDQGTYWEFDIIGRGTAGIDLTAGKICRFTFVSDPPIKAVVSMAESGESLIVSAPFAEQVELLGIKGGVGISTTTVIGTGDNFVAVSLDAGLDDLNDVDLTVPPTTNQLLVFNGTSWTAQSGAGGVLNNLTAIVDPTATDDAVAGYSILSQWLNTVTNMMWVCTKAIAPAIWRPDTSDFGANSVRISHGASLSAGATNCVVIGHTAAVTNSNNATAVGNSSITNAANAIGIGSATLTEPRSIGIGRSATCSGQNTVAVGDSTLALGRGHIALGSGAVTTTTSRLALGFDGQNNVAVGTQFARLPVAIDGIARQLLMRDTDINLDALTDVVVTAPATGNRLVYDGTNFVNAIPDLPLFALFPGGVTSVVAVNASHFLTFSVPLTATYSKMALWPTGGNPASGLRVAIYDGIPTGGAGTVLLRESNTLTSHTSMVESEVTFSAPITLTRGQAYTFGVTTQSGATWGLSAGVSNTSFARWVSGTYYGVTGFPADLSGVSFTGTTASRYMSVLRG